MNYHDFRTKNQTQLTIKYDTFKNKNPKISNFDGCHCLNIR